MPRSATIRYARTEASAWKDLGSLSSVVVQRVCNICYETIKNILIKLVSSKKVGQVDCATRTSTSALRLLAKMGASVSISLLHIRAPVCSVI